MTSGWNKWQERFQKRFVDRDNLGRQVVYEQFWGDLPIERVMALFDFLEVEYTLAPGLLRPSDPIKIIVGPVTTNRRFISWFYKSRADDTKSELTRQLRKRAKQHGTEEAWEGRTIETVDDLLRVWCGVSPRDQIR